MKKLIKTKEEQFQEYLDSITAKLEKNKYENSYFRKLFGLTKTKLKFVSGCCVYDCKAISHVDLTSKRKVFLTENNYFILRKKISYYDSLYCEYFISQKLTDLIKNPFFDLYEA